MTASQYPAYHMLLSARDMARLGLLMLRQGRWRDRQLIPAEWVRRSTTICTPSTGLRPWELRNGPTVFFNNTENLQLTFKKNSRGEAVAIIHHMAGVPDSEGSKLKNE